MEAERGPRHERAFRYNNRKMNDGDRFDIVVRQIRRRAIDVGSTHLGRRKQRKRNHDPLPRKRQDGADTGGEGGNIENMDDLRGK